MSDHPEEFNEFLFTPKDRPDGSKPTDEEEVRRLKTLKALVEKAAMEEGIVLIPKGSHPPEPIVKTERSAEITQKASMMMPVEDEKVRTTIEFAKETPDGGRKLVRIRLGIFDDVGDALKAIAKTPGQAVEITKLIVGGGVRLGIHVGTQLKAKVSVGGNTKEQDEIEEDINL